MALSQSVRSRLASVRLYASLTDRGRVAAREAGAVLVLSLGVMTTLSLLSYAPSDASLNQAWGAGTASVNNWIGPMGALWADLCFQVMGIAAWLFNAALLINGARLIVGRSRPITQRQLLAVVGLLTSFGTLVELLTIGNRSSYPLGGVFGALFARILREHFAPVGAATLAATGAVLSLTVCLGGVLSSLAKRLGEQVGLLRYRAEQRGRQALHQARSRLAPRQLRALWATGGLAGRVAHGHGPLLPVSDEPASAPALLDEATPGHANAEAPQPQGDDFAAQTVHRATLATGGVAAPSDGERPVWGPSDMAAALAQEATEAGPGADADGMEEGMLPLLSALQARGHDAEAAAGAAHAEDSRPHDSAQPQDPAWAAREAEAPLSAGAVDWGLPRQARYSDGSGAEDDHAPATPSEDEAHQLAAVAGDDQEALRMAGLAAPATHADGGAEVVANAPAERDADVDAAADGRFGSEAAAAADAGMLDTAGSTQELASAFVAGAEAEATPAPPTEPLELQDPAALPPPDEARTEAERALGEAEPLRQVGGDDGLAIAPAQAPWEAALQPEGDDAWHFDAPQKEADAADAADAAVAADAADGLLDAAQEVSLLGSEEDDEQRGLALLAESEAELAASAGTAVAEAAAQDAEGAADPERAAQVQGEVPAEAATEDDAAADEAMAPVVEAPDEAWVQGEAKDSVAEPASAMPASPPYVLPPLDLLRFAPSERTPVAPEVLQENAARLTKTLSEYGIDGHVREIRPGPVVTLYEYVPGPGIKLARIASLADDLAMSMEAFRVRIVAPIPGKGAVGIEIPNEGRELVHLKEIVAQADFAEAPAPLTMALGKDIEGAPCVADLARMPHLLVAGATGAGKSVSVNAMIMSVLFKASPEEVRMIMVDPKMLELSVYEGIPHLLLPVVTDPKKAATALRWAVEEMERRYELLSEVGVRSIDGFNARVAAGQARGEPLSVAGSDAAMPRKVCERLPYLLVIVDELADLMMVASREVESSIMRLAQMARAAGIHLIVATQRPSVDVLTGVIKANFPTRIAFQVASRHDSRTIIDANGAEHLLGRGDMLLMSSGAGGIKRVHGAYVSEEDIERTVAFVRGQRDPDYDESILLERNDDGEQELDSDIGRDDMYDQAVAIVAETRQASVSMIQRRLRIGYNRAARMVEWMEQEGIVGPGDGAKPREVFVHHPSP